MKCPAERAHWVARPRLKGVAFGLALHPAKEVANQSGQDFGDLMDESLPKREWSRSLHGIPARCGGPTDGSLIGSRSRTSKGLHRFRPHSAPAFRRSRGSAAEMTSLSARKWSFRSWGMAAMPFARSLL